MSSSQINNKFESIFTDLTKNYDVYLSFCDKDSGPFVSHLYNALKSEAKVSVFWDDERYAKLTVSESVLNVIGKCKMVIIIFSTNYVKSIRCLQELDKTTECCRTTYDLIVVPLFYDGIYPSDGTFHRNLYADSDFVHRMLIGETEDNFMTWMVANSQATTYPGSIDILNKYGNESEYIKNVVEHVTRVLNKRDLFSAYTESTDSRAQDVIQLLKQSTGLLEDKSLLTIDENNKLQMHVLLQAMVKDIIKREPSNMTNQPKMYDVFLSFRGEDSRAKFISHLHSSLQNAGIHTFRDDDEIERGDQISTSLLQAIGQSTISIVVLSTNYANSRWCMVELEKIMEIGRTKGLVVVPVFYEVDPSEVRHQKGEFGEKFDDLLSKISVDEYTKSNWRRDLIDIGGIAGFVLIDSRNESADIKNIVERVTRLLDRTELFVAEHPVGVKSRVQAATKLLNIENSKDVLLLGIWGMGGTERSLVTVDNRNKLRMHDLLRDMGRHIIYEESPFDPEKRSRLWRREEVFDILSKYKGTEAVKGLTLEFPIKKSVALNTKAFKKMNKLRLLRLAGVQLNGDFKYLSGELRWLHWHGFPSTYAPAEFQQGILVAVTLKYSNLKQIWKKSQMLENLKILNLSHSRNLTETPEFSDMPNLEKLVLKDCPSLSAVSHTIGSLDKLLLINLTDCTGLLKLPRSIYKLKSLETLILSGCSMIDKLEEDLEQLESLTTLIADKTAITKVPFSIVRSKSIGYISLCGFKGFSCDVFPSLIFSWMSPSNNVISRVQTSVSLSSLGNFKDLLKLRSLCVECGSQLQLNQDVARILDIFKATDSHKFEASTSATTSQISDMYASPLIGDCLGLVHLSRSKNYSKSFLIQMGTKCQVSNITEDGIFQTADGSTGSFMPPSNNKSDWFNLSCKGCSVTFDVPTMKGNNLKSMMLFVTYYSSPDNITSECCQGVLIINYTKTTIHAYKRDTLTSFGHGDWQTITSNLEPGNKVEVMVVFGEGFIVEKTTLSLLYDEPINKEMKHCKAVHEEDVIVSSGGNIDIPADNNVTGPQQDENESEDEHGHAICRKRKR
ncbi:disease resistance protein RPS6 [Trifolium repens]|nr:disease resistance protein RPS6 [Trifolium repens]